MEVLVLIIWLLVISVIAVELAIAKRPKFKNFKFNKKHEYYVKDLETGEILYGREF